jgi:hypothetical protein
MGLFGSRIRLKRLLNVYRFTDRVRAVIRIANHTAIGLDAEIITPDHFFVAILYQGSSLGMTLLRISGVVKGESQHPYASLVQAPADKWRPEPKLPLAKSSKDLIDAADREAARLGDNHVGTEHMVLALADLAGSALQREMLNAGSSIIELRVALSMIRNWAAGDAAVGRRRWTEAVDRYRAALAIKLDPIVSNNLAWILATCPDDTIRSGQDALSLMKAVVTDRSDAAWWMLGTVAAAYAEVGDFDAAKAWGGHAMELAAGADDGKWESRIAGFEQRQPVRDV